MKNSQKIKKGDLIKVRLDNGKLDGVVYTVQATVRRGGRSLPVILDYWQPVIVTEFERATPSPASASSSATAGDDGTLDRL